MENKTELLKFIDKLHILYNVFSFEIVLKILQFYYIPLHLKYNKNQFSRLKIAPKIIKVILKGDLKLQ